MAFLCCVPEELNSEVIERVPVFAVRLDPTSEVESPKHYDETSKHEEKGKEKTAETELPTQKSKHEEKGDQKKAKTKLPTQSGWNQQQETLEKTAVEVVIEKMETKDATLEKSEDVAQRKSLRLFGTIKDPMNRADLKKLSGFLTGTESPTYSHVSAWFWSVSGGDNRCSKNILFVTFLMLALDYVISVVLATAGISLAWLYHEVFDWNNDSSFKGALIFGVIGGIFTAWNIAQYASYAIQTTGHLSVWQHLKAVRLAVPVLLPCNLVGWALCLLVYFTPLVDMNTPVKTVVIAGPPIALGIGAKTLWKLKYLAAHSRKQSAADLKDALGNRLAREQATVTSPISCPFADITCALWGKHAAVPFTCFIWTVFYVVALRLCYEAAETLDEVPMQVVQVVLFAVSMLFTVVGLNLLFTWVQKFSGYFGYSDQMLVAFILIYALVSDVQVRLGLVKMTGAVRLICSLVHPFCFSGVRSLMMRQWNRMSKMDHEANSIARKNEPLFVLSIMGIIIVQNVSAVLLPAMACQYKDMPLSLGTCGEYGLVQQVFRDAAVTWIMNVLTVATLVRQGVCILYFFSMLDVFLTIAAVLVVYMCMLLALLTACMHL